MRLMCPETQQIGRPRLYSPFVSFRRNRQPTVIQCLRDEITLRLVPSASVLEDF